MSERSRRKFKLLLSGALAAILAAALMLTSASALAQVQTLTGGTAANSSLQKLAISGSTYMGPGMGYLTDPGNDTAGAVTVAVPLLMPGTATSAHLANLAVQLSGSAGNDSISGYNFVVCVTHAGSTSCSSSGVSCTLTGSSTYCSDTTHSIAISAGDQAMVKATAVGDATDNTGVKWSLQITP